MFSFLGTIVGYLGYINLSAKLKNQIYTILASCGNFYLLYVAYRFFLNGFYGRATLFILAFLVIGYFAYLNFLYYFTNKTSKYDISPKIEKILGIENKATEKKIKESQVTPGFVPTNGIFNANELLPTTLNFSKEQQQNLNELVKILEKNGYLKLDYANKDEQTLYELAKKNNQVYALDNAITLPYFELQGLEVYGGLNQLEKRPLATLKTIGLLEASSAKKTYQISLATVIITGGPYKTCGRASLMPEIDADFTLEIQVAYQKTTH